MKLGKHTQRTEPIRAVSVLSEERLGEKLFDLRRDVPQAMWEKVASKMQEFLETPKATGILDGLAILAEINPVVQTQLQHDPLFMEALRQVAKARWLTFGSADRINRKFILQDLGNWLPLLPEFRQELEPLSDLQLGDILNSVKEELITGKSLSISALMLPTSFHIPAQLMVSLLRLFPDQAEQVRKVLDDPEFKTRFDARMSELLLHEKGWGKFLDLVDASFLYPDQADHYKQSAQPYWGDVKQEIKNSGPKLSISIRSEHLLWAAHVFGADKAYLDSKGELHVEYAKPLTQGVELPPRLMT